MNLIKRLTGNQKSDPTTPREIVVRLKHEGDELARGILNETVIFNEGGYYFAPEVVNSALLQAAARDDACTLQGKARWFDVVRDGETLYENVGWRFYELKRGYGHLRDRIGFPVHGIPAIMVEGVE
jgi:uncharacterized protein (DUF427 family)